MIRLSIKGTVDEVSKALDDHGVHPTDRGPIVERSEGICVLEVVGGCEPGVVRWFCEDHATPFPPGTLLHYAREAS